MAVLYSRRDRQWHISPKLRPLATVGLGIALITYETLTLNLYYLPIILIGAALGH